MEAGKGDIQRPFDRKKFEEGYERIFGEKKVLDCDGEEIPNWIVKAAERIPIITECAGEGKCEIMVFNFQWQCARIFAEEYEKWKKEKQQ